MEVEIIGIEKDGNDTLLSIRCTSPLELVSPDELPSPEIAAKMGKSLLTLIREEDDRVDKRKEEIAEYKKQINRLRLGFAELEGYNK